MNYQKNWETLNKNESKNKYIEITKNENRIAEKEAQLRSVKGHGYSPEKRFLEAAEILEKEGSSSPRYLWRKAVLKAEIKYGKYLNKIQDNTESGYSELIEALKKNHDYKCEAMYISTDDSTRIQKLARYSGDDKPVDLSDPTKDNIRAIVDDFQEIINIPLKIHFGSVIPDNVYMFPGKKAVSEIASAYKRTLKDFQFWKDESNGFIDMGGIMAKDNDTYKSGYNILGDPATHIKESLYNEIGHLVEASIPGATKISQALLKDRGTESLLSSSVGDLAKTNFGNSLKGKTIAEDHFFHPYMGVQYTKNNITTVTELVSSGFEGLSSPWMARSMAIRDRESLLYTIAVSEMN